MHFNKDVVDFRTASPELQAQQSVLIATIDAKDATLFDGAIRELKEESGLDVTRSGHKFTYVCSLETVAGRCVIVNFVIKTSILRWNNRLKIMLKNISMM